MCYKCGHSRRLIGGCRPKDPELFSHSATVTLPSELVKSSNFRKLSKWLFNLASTRHITNDLSYFTNLVACKGVAQVGNDKEIRSLEHATVRVTTSVTIV